jgi:flagellar biosynthesis activator protein FlaF
MYPSSQARSAYAAAPVRTARDAEYAVFASVTHALRAADETNFPQVARAVSANQRLWGALADDLMSDRNALPLQLRANLISISEFVRKHSMAVLGGRAGVAPLIDINTMIMRGLRGDVEAAA